MAKYITKLMVWVEIKRRHTNATMNKVYWCEMKCHLFQLEYTLFGIPGECTIFVAALAVAYCAKIVARNSPVSMCNEEISSITRPMINLIGIWPWGKWSHSHGRSFCNLCRLL